MKKFILTAIKSTSSILFMTGLIAGGLFLISDDEIIFQSLESKTSEGLPVFNKIKWIKTKDKEIWMMNQSHHGLQSTQWDRLAIIIDLKSRPTKATFLQLPPGKLQWSENLFQEKIHNRVSCFMCHSNGPRAIRYDTNEKNSLSFSSKVKVFIWNQRIKFYGRVIEDPSHKLTDAHLKVPFRHRGKNDNQILKVKTCMMCHSNDGFFARGELTRQNAIAIDFMLKNNFMPPKGIDFPEKERLELNYFINGF